MAAKKQIKKPRAKRRTKVEAKSKGLGAKDLKTTFDGLTGALFGGSNVCH